MDSLLVTRDQHVATVTFNRPERHNAITFEMFGALPQLFTELDADPDVRVIVLRGAGERAFASGADIGEFESVRGTAETARIYNAQVAQAERTLAGMAKPSIAMIRGYCIGGGCGIALAADLRFADSTAMLAITPAKLGVVYGLESTKRLVDLVGPSRAKWILMSGSHLTADRAQALGLLDEVLPTGELEQHTYDFARLVAGRSQVSVRAAKVMVNRIVAGQVEDDDTTTHLRNNSVESADYAEGVRAFLEKRTPNFS
jgi:enoyl-CoA hydratase/carnithine racemase